MTTNKATIITPNEDESEAVSIDVEDEKQHRYPGRLFWFWRFWMPALLVICAFAVAIVILVLYKPIADNIAITAINGITVLAAVIGWVIYYIRTRKYFVPRYGKIVLLGLLLVAALAVVAAVLPWSIKFSPQGLMVFQIASAVLASCTVLFAIRQAADMRSVAKQVRAQTAIADLEDEADHEYKNQYTVADAFEPFKEACTTLNNLSSDKKQDSELLFSVVEGILGIYKSKSEFHLKRITEIDSMDREQDSYENFFNTQIQNQATNGMLTQQDYDCCCMLGSALNAKLLQIYATDDKKLSTLYKGKSDKKKDHSLGGGGDSIKPGKQEAL